MKGDGDDVVDKEHGDIGGDGRQRKRKVSRKKGESHKKKSEKVREREGERKHTTSSSKRSGRNTTATRKSNKRDKRGKYPVSSSTSRGDASARTNTHAYQQHRKNDIPFHNSAYNNFLERQKKARQMKEYAQTGVSDLFR
jgi:hypothetical protein